MGAPLARWILPPYDGGMADLWSGFEHDPRDPAYAPVRASDRDRDVILHALGDAYAEGRLTREEYDERSDQVAAARTLGELPLLLADLVPTTALEARNAFVPATSDLAATGSRQVSEGSAGGVGGLHRALGDLLGDLARHELGRRIRLDPLAALGDAGDRHQPGSSARPTADHHRQRDETAREEGRESCGEGCRESPAQRARATSGRRLSSGLRRPSRPVGASSEASRPPAGRTRRPLPGAHRPGFRRRRRGRSSRTGRCKP